MNREALEQAVRVLKAAHEAKKKFDISNWVGERRRRPGARVLEIACTSSACAAGYCGLDPWFIERGFYLKAADGPLFGKLHVDPVYRDDIAFDAVQAFFGSTYSVGQALFHPDGYVDEEHPDDDTPPTALDVAIKIEGLLEDGTVYHRTEDTNFTQED